MLVFIIFGFIDYEILLMVKVVVEVGVILIGYMLVCLNGDIGMIFEDWIKKVLLDWVEWVLNWICDCWGGNLYEYCFYKCMRGEGEIVEMVSR